MSLARGVLCGALGFGLGFFVAGLLGDLMLPGLFLACAVGGAGVAWGAARRSYLWRITLAATVSGGIGFALAFFIVLALWEPPLLSDVFIGLVGGGLLGLGIGTALRQHLLRHRLAIGSSLAFALGFLAFSLLPSPLEGGTCCTLEQSLLNGARLALAGAIGGAGTGAVAAWAIHPRRNLRPLTKGR